MVYLNQLNFNVNGNLLTLNNKPMITSGSVNYDTCIFNFNKAWRGFSKNAVFITEDGECYCVAVENNNSCKIPRDCILKRGLLKIGVVGENEDFTVISTNMVTYRIIHGANEENPELPNEPKPEPIEPVIPTPESQSPVALWMDDRIRLSNGLISDSYVDADNTDINTYYDEVFSKLADKYPDYVHRFTHLEDSTGNIIDSFTFEGNNWDRTIIITANYFGYNIATLSALGVFLKDLCENYENNPALRFLHNKVRIIVLPIACPEALLSRTRVNSNGVAPFVNFEHYWEDSTIEDKGEFVFSEPETVPVLELVETCLNENLVWVLDLESGNDDWNGKRIYYKANKGVDINFFANAVEKFNSDYAPDGFGIPTEYYESHAPISTNYITETYGINSCTVIWGGKYSTEFNNVSNVNYADFIANVAFEIAFNGDELKKTKQDPSLKHITWRLTSPRDKLTLTTAVKPMWVSAYKQKIYSASNVHMSGYVKVESETAAKMVIRPILYQNSSLTDNYDNRVSNNNFDVELDIGVGISVIPFDTVIKVGNNSESDSNEDSLLVSVLAGASTVPVDVIGYSYTLDVQPSDKSNGVEVLTPEGASILYTSAEKTPKFKQRYPKIFNDII